MTRQAPTTGVHVSVRGALPPGSVQYAEDTIGKLLRLAPEPVLNVTVRLADSPAVYPRVLAQANLDLNGRPLRAQVAGSTAAEAIGLLADCLWRQLTKARHRRTHRDTVPTSRPIEPWSRRPVPNLRPAAKRRLVRRKSFTLPQCTVNEAAFEMNLMDYDFHLFTEIETGQDSVLYRTAGGAEYRLAQIDPQPARIDPTGLSLSVDTQPAPQLTAQQAAQRLELSGQPFVFFVDADSGRGRLLYVRYDGHYGLISPATAEHAPSSNGRTERRRT